MKHALLALAAILAVTTGARTAPAQPGESCAPLVDAGGRVNVPALESLIAAGYDLSRAAHILDGASSDDAPAFDAAGLALQSALVNAHASPELLARVQAAQSLDAAAIDEALEWLYMWVDGCLANGVPITPETVRWLDVQATLEGCNGAALAVAFLDGGRVLAITGADGCRVFWDMQRWTCVSPEGEPAGPGIPAQALEAGQVVALAAQGDRAAAGDFDGGLHLFDVNGNALPSPGRHETAILSLAFDPAAARLAAGDYDSVRLWSLDPVAAEPVAVLARVPVAASLAFNPAADLLAIGTAYGVMLWPLPGGAPVFLDDGGGMVADVAFSDGRGVMLATTTEEGQAAIWRVPGMSRLVDAAHPRCEVTAEYDLLQRAEPYIAYNALREMPAGVIAFADAQALGDDGYTWWRLWNGAWVREDVVGESGDCAALPVAELPD